MATTVKGILFDLGDTLLDFQKVRILKLFKAGGRLAHAYVRQLGKPVPSFRKFHGRQRRMVRWAYLKSLLTRREFCSMDLLTEYHRGLGHDLTGEEFSELAWLWYRPLSERAGVEEGLGQLLADFRDSGIKLGIVSNTFLPPAVLDRHLAGCGLLDLLPTRVYSCQMRCRKPDRRIFAEALRRAELDAAGTMFVGDLPRTDILGANRSGCISVLKDPNGTHDSSSIRPRHRIRALAELRDLVARYNGR